MEINISIFITAAIAIVVALIGIIYRSIGSKINEVKADLAISLNELKLSLKNGLSTKVDGIEYVIKNKWQESEYGDLKLIIRELRAANDASHQAIMIEIKRTNDTLKRGGEDESR